MPEGYRSRPTKKFSKISDGGVVFEGTVSEGIIPHLEFTIEFSSNDLIYEIRKVSEEIPLIGVGGVMSQKDYKEKLALGADLVQIYTGFIMEGPGLIHKIINK